MNSIAVSVVLNKAALGTVTAAQVQAAIAGAFAYPVKVNVLVAPFQRSVALPGSGGLLQDAGPVSSALLEVIAALALLFGVALPGGRWLAAFSTTSPVRPQRRRRRRRWSIEAQPPPPPLNTSALREQAAENPAEIAKLLQSWVEENE